MSSTCTDTSDVLSFALNLTRASGSGGGWVGGWRDSTASTVYVGWHWVDGTDASNLNCGSRGCGVFSTGQPKYVVLRAHCHAQSCCCWAWYIPRVLE
jgi:hypothetical protein